MTDNKELLCIVKILGIPIPVELVDYTDDEDEVTFGHFDSINLNIQLNKSASHLHQRLTLLHEWLHAAEELLGIGLEHKDVYSLSQAIYGLLYDNKKILQWLLKEPLGGDNEEQQVSEEPLKGVVYKHGC